MKLTRKEFQWHLENKISPGIKKMTRDRMKAIVMHAGLQGRHAPKWRKKYRDHFNGAWTRGKGSKLSFTNYIQLVIASGLTLPSQIGTHNGDWQLARWTDTGPYTLKSCRFVTAEENREDKEVNGGHAAAGDKNRGKTKETDEGIARRAASAEKEFILISPECEIFEGQALGAFCRKMKLSFSIMSEVCRGLKDHHRGWLGTYIDLTGIYTNGKFKLPKSVKKHQLRIRTLLAEDKFKNAKECVLFSPEGKEFRAYNLAELCERFGLTKPLMSLVCRGLATHHKGWTGHYV